MISSLAHVYEVVDLRELFFFREANRNDESPGSHDVVLNQPTNVDESLPFTPSKKNTFCNCLK